MPESPQWQPERYRPLLCLVMRMIGLRARLRRRYDVSDVVQEALVRAVDNLPQCRAETEEEFVAWLKRILRNTARDMADAEGAGKRDPAREQLMDEIAEEATTRVKIVIGDRHQPTPSQEVERQETLRRMAVALEQLPDDQRQTVILHKLMQQSMAEVAEALGRSKKAVAGLYARGLHKLRELMGGALPEGPGNDG
jgi:RNA polymerase sigma-70 factor (ECF subfamily)